MRAVPWGGIRTSLEYSDTSRKRMHRTTLEAGDTIISRVIEEMDCSNFCDSKNFTIVFLIFAEAYKFRKRFFDFPSISCKTFYLVSANVFERTNVL